MTDSDIRVRIDKWLWAARFYKTRSLGADAVEGGKVQVNGERVKPAKGSRPGTPSPSATDISPGRLRCLH